MEKCIVYLYVFAAKKDIQNLVYILLFSFKIDATLAVEQLKCISFLTVVIYQT